MSVNVDEAEWRFAAPDGGSTSYTIGMVLSGDDVFAALYGGDGEEIALSGFSVANVGEEDGATVTFDDAPDADGDDDAELVIWRATPKLQSSEIDSFGGSTGLIAERRHDRAMLILQELALGAARGLRLHPKDTGPLPALPLLSDLLQKYLYVTADGAVIGIDGPTDAGDLVVSAFIETLLDDANAAAARATLGITALLDPQTLTNTLLNGVAFTKGYIAGWTYQNGTDATNDLNIAAGCGVDSAGAKWMSGAALTKQLDAVWAAGNNAGGRLSGSLADGDYYVWAIGHATTYAVDYGFETTANATPTLPSGYGHYRRIGWFKRASGTIVAFKAYELAGGGLHFLWAAPTKDVDLANTLTSTRRTDAVKVPLTFSVLAELHVIYADTTDSGSAYIYCPDLDDLAPSHTASPGVTVHTVTTKTGVSRIEVRTSATGTVAARSVGAEPADAYRLFTLGFKDARR